MSETFPQTGEGPFGPHPIGQCHSSGIYKQTGRDKISFPLSVNVGPIQVVLNQQCPNESNTCAGETKSPGRLPEQRQGGAHGVGTTPGSGEDGFQHSGKTACRSVRIGNKCGPTNLLHKVASFD